MNVPGKGFQDSDRLTVRYHPRNVPAVFGGGGYHAQLYAGHVFTHRRIIACAPERVAVLRNPGVLVPRATRNHELFVVNLRVAHEHDLVLRAVHIVRQPNEDPTVVGPASIRLINAIASLRPRRCGEIRQGCFRQLVDRHQ